MPSDDDAQRPEPDVRFTLANERTFLAWSRTALALIAAGLAIAQLLPPFPHVPWGRSVIATPLILLGAVVPGLSYREWQRTQRAIRRGGPPPPSQLPKILAITITVIALVAATVDLYSKVRVH
jgi:putative membrane protein